jgi:hypothetical protein
MSACSPLKPAVRGQRTAVAHGPALPLPRARAILHDGDVPDPLLANWHASPPGLVGSPCSPPERRPERAQYTKRDGRSAARGDASVCGVYGSRVSGRAQTSPRRRSPPPPPTDHRTESLSGFPRRHSSARRVCRLLALPSCCAGRVSTAARVGAAGATASKQRDRARRSTGTARGRRPPMATSLARRPRSSSRSRRAAKVAESTRVTGWRPHRAPDQQRPYTSLQPAHCLWLALFMCPAGWTTGGYSSLGTGHARSAGPDALGQCGLAATATKRCVTLAAIGRLYSISIRPISPEEALILRRPIPSRSRVLVRRSVHHCCCFTVQRTWSPPVDFHDILRRCRSAR